MTVVKMILNDPCGHDIMGTVDIKKETGFIKTCQHLKWVGESGTGVPGP